MLKTSFKKEKKEKYRSSGSHFSYHHVMAELYLLGTDIRKQIKKQDLWKHINQP